ncbi:A disintegrin and metalloproteinase with thrombospondin motifs 18 [Elysia marginata]|uniref:A disintegrin and metalloproteinase with thrombospondin motifs 18 n=1 Tax=Elysia marginata TaxID=1093978 RepID=A0AAV4HT96_9GAST|nr:A disintegrin and metalloproteinase with thrombospondin motifs 18 [Elysia marginata]
MLMESNNIKNPPSPTTIFNTLLNFKQPNLTCFCLSFPQECPYGDRYPKWCPTVTPYRCYNETVREWCCTSCSQLHNASRGGCEYGDKFENCEDLIYPYACYHPTNQDACCGFCSIYSNVIEGADDTCKYGDKQAWCWKLTLTYDESEWCPLDAENDHCCGTCRYNNSAVPVFGYRLLEEGFDQVTFLGNQFKTEVRAAVEERKKEEEALKQKEEEKKKAEEERRKQSEKVEAQKEEAGEVLRLGESREPDKTANSSLESDDTESVNIARVDNEISTSADDVVQTTVSPPLELV